MPDNKPPQGQMEIADALDAIRKERQPTRRGIVLCANTMAVMIRLGWQKDALDSLEILWWSIRDGNGELLPPTSIGRGTEEQPAPLLFQ